MPKEQDLEKSFGLDAPMAEAVKRFAKAVQDEADERGEQPDLIQEGTAQLVLFKGSEIRKIFHVGEWWFSITDVVGVLVESTNPRRYWSELKHKLFQNEGFSELYEKVVQLKMPSSDGKTEATDAATTETIFRILQSVPSKRAEPFKRWLARVGYERILETQNPEIAIKRAITAYQLQGRSGEWIEKRIRSIVVRKELTGEWKRRGVDGSEYGSLTDIISTRTFGIGVRGHRRVKSLKPTHNLRDHMTDLELIFTMLGEKSTTEITRSRNAQGYSQAAQAAHAGGQIAGTAREELEREMKSMIVSPLNFLGDSRRHADPVRLSQPADKVK